MESYDDSQSDPRSPSEPEAVGAIYEEPTTGTPKVIGTLNIVFASILMLCGACYAAQMAAQTMMAPMMEAQMEQMEETLKAQREQQVQELEAQAETAETEEDAAAIRAEITTLQATPIPVMPNMAGMYGIDDPRVLAYYAGDIITGLVLNLLMLFSGIGLLGLKEWGRKLAIWVAALKVVRLMILCVVVALVVAPVFAKAMGDMMDEMMQAVPAGGGAPPPGAETIAVMYGTMMTAGAVALLIFGSIYPILQMWLLNGAAVKAACRRS